MDPVTLYHPHTQQPVVVTVPTEDARLRAAGYSDTAPAEVVVPDTAGDGDGEPETFDPAQHTVADVKTFMAEHPELAETVLAAERAGQNRVTLTGGTDAGDEGDGDEGDAPA